MDLLTLELKLDYTASIKATPSGFTFFFVLYFADAEDVRVGAGVTCTFDFVEVFGVKSNVAFGAVLFEEVDRDEG